MLAEGHLSMYCAAAKRGRLARWNGDAGGRVDDRWCSKVVVMVGLHKLAIPWQRWWPSRWPEMASVGGDGGRMLGAVESRMAPWRSSVWTPVNTLQTWQNLKHLLRDLQLDRYLWAEPMFLLDFYCGGLLWRRRVGVIVWPASMASNVEQFCGPLSSADVLLLFSSQRSPTCLSTTD